VLAPPQRRGVAVASRDQSPFDLDADVYLDQVLNIAGPGSEGLTITGDGAGRAFEVAAGIGPSANSVAITGG